METIFENTCVDTQEEYYQLFSWLAPKYVRIASVVFCVIGAIALLAYATGDLTYLLSGIWLILSGVYLLLSGRINGKAYYNKKVKVYGETLPPKTYHFFETHFRVFDVDSDATIDYSRIKKVGFLKDCIAIMVEPAGVVYTMSNNSFTKGTLSEFKQFLRVKCPNLTIPE